MKNNTGNTHALRAVFALREKILSGEFAPGVRLREVALAEELNISRTPVRDAMSRLAEEGLLERAEKGGFVIRRFGLEDIVDSIELRGVLEGTVARLAAEKGVPKAKLNEIKRILEKIDECFSEADMSINLEQYAALNADFHNALSKLADSSLIEKELLRVTRMPFASPSAFMPDKKGHVTSYLSLHASQEQHRQLISAIEAREGNRAESIAREHARVARINLELAIEENSFDLGKTTK